jgi:hypothetical protein
VVFFVEMEFKEHLRSLTTDDMIGAFAVVNDKGSTRSPEDLNNEIDERLTYYPGLVDFPTQLANALKATGLDESAQIYLHAGAMMTVNTLIEFAELEAMPPLD